MRHKPEFYGPCEQFGCIGRLFTTVPSKKYIYCSMCRFRENFVTYKNTVKENLSTKENAPTSEASIKR